MPGSVVLAAVVEGHGEVRALPHLLRRIAGEVHGVWNIQVPTPFRLDSGKMLKPEELHRATRFQAARVLGPGGVIVVRDGDDAACPIDLARALHAATGPSTRPVQIVVARQEYEAWFLAALPSLTRHASVRDGVGPVADPEEPRAAKSVLESHMTEPYRETRHQEDFSALLDLREAMIHSRSFRRLAHAVQLLLS